MEISKHDIEVECLPKDLPEVIKIDISDLDLNQYIHVKDIKIEDTIKVLTNLDTVIVGVYTPKISAVEEEAPAAEEEAEEKSGESSEE